MRPFPLTVLKGGINRLRVKGAASANFLYDLQNAYVTNVGSVVPREGTIRAATLSSSNVGLVAANGTFNVFSSAWSTAALPANYALNILHDPVNSTASPTIIWYAKPFMGFLYVVAQFTDGLVFHYWLQNNGTWTSNTDYTSASIVLPPVADGLAYQGGRSFPPSPLWSPNVLVTAANFIEPNVPNGFAYQAITATGTPIRTSMIEPIWPVIPGGTVQEFGDFDLSSTDAGTTQPPGVYSTAAPLGGTITNRYGNSNVISNAGVFATSSTFSTLTLASTKVTPWKAGTNYAPGAVVIPTTNQGAFINAIPNGDFSGGSGAGGWTFADVGGAAAFSWTTGASPLSIGIGSPVGGASIGVSAGSMGGAGASATMTSYGIVVPGQAVTATAYCNPNNNGADLTMWIQLNWYTAADVFISAVGNQKNEQEGFSTVLMSVTGSAPANAAHVRVGIGAGSGTSSRNIGYVGLVSWNLETPSPISNFLYEAVQPAAGSSAATEPTWPTILGNTVTDNGVTWKAIGTSIITWQAIPLMQSGPNPPLFNTLGTAVGSVIFDTSSYMNSNGLVINTTMYWTAIDRHVTDGKCPNTIAVALGASHVFAGDNDIVDYSAAVNPIDWSSTNNAGYLPTGLNNYGDNPVAVLALYRSNLVVMNAGGYQMWQIDPDPANMALLDAQPIGSVFTRAGQSVANDYLFLTEVGVRNLGTVGATANMAIGDTGQPVDPLVMAQITTSTSYVTSPVSTSRYPLSAYYPGRGQYWLIFGPQVFVLTINGSNQKSWSRYIFPDSITDWTLNAGILYLRTKGNLVWQIDAGSAPYDDVNTGGVSPPNIPFDGVMQWPYLDAGVLGFNKMLVGVDIVGDGSVVVQIGHNQGDKTSFNDNPNFATTTGATIPYAVAIDDTVASEPLPIPCSAPSYSLILKFPGVVSSAANYWTWEAANLYLMDVKGGGTTG